jgi:hypothetical protein
MPCACALRSGEIVLARRCPAEAVKLAAGTAWELRAALIALARHGSDGTFRVPGVAASDGGAAAALVTLEFRTAFRARLEELRARQAARQALRTLTRAA